MNTNDHPVTILTVDHQKLLRCLTKLIGVVDRRSVPGVYTHFLLRVEEEELYIFASDGNIQLSANLTLKSASQKNVSFTLPARKLYDICRSIDRGDEINIQIFFSESEDGFDEEMETHHGHAVLMSEGFTYNLGIFSSESFATIENLGADNSRTSIWIPANTIRRNLSKGLPCIAMVDTQAYMRGVTLQARKNQRLVFITVDGLRMTHLECHHHEKIESDREVIIPRKAVLELSRILEPSDIKIQLDIGQTYLRIISSEFILITKLIDATPPDHMAIVPSNINHRARVDTELLMAMLRRSTIVFSDKQKLIYISFEDGQLTARTENTEKELLQEKIEIDYSGEPVEVILNASHFMELLPSIESEQTEICLADGKTNVLLRDLSKENDWHILAPYIHASIEQEDEELG